MEMESLCSDVVVLERFVLSSVMEAVVLETAIVATKSIAWLFFLARSLPSGMDVLLREPETIKWLTLGELYTDKQHYPENKDSSETEDDDEDDEDEADDQEDDAGDEDEISGDEGKDDNKGDPEDELEANGEGGSGDEDDEDDDDDDDDDSDDSEEDEEEEEEEEDDEEVPQPPTKKRK